MILIAAIVDSSNRLSLVAYIATCFFFCAFTSSYVNTLFFSLAVFLNYALSLGEILGIISMRYCFFVFMVVAALYIIIAKGKWKKKVHPGFLLLMIGWFLYISFNTISVSHRGVETLLGVFILFLISLVFRYLVEMKTAYARKMLLTVFVAFTFIIIVSILEHMLGHTFFSSQWTINERYRYGILRTGSTMADANNVCYMLVPFQFIMHSEAFESLFPSRWLKIARVANFLVILATTSRTGILALCLGYIVISLAKSRLLVSILFFTALAGLSAFESFYLNILGQDVASTSFRLYVAGRATEAILSNKWIGVGPPKLLEIVGSGNTMNTYLYVLGGYGIVGLVFYVLMTIGNIENEIRQWLTQKRISKEIVVRISIVIAYSVIAYSLDTFFLGLIWIIPALFSSMNHIGGEGLHE